MPENPPDFRPFHPGRPPDDDTGPQESRPEAFRLESTGARVDKPDGDDAAPPKGFAVPEPSGGRLLHHSTVLLREATEEDEDVLIEASGQSVLEPRRLEARRYEILFVVLLFCLGTLAILASSFNVGMCWDEAYYVDASRDTLDWLSATSARDGFALTDADLINHYWDAARREPRGHGAITRWLTAIGMALSPNDRAPLGWMRAPVAVCFGLTLVLVYALARHCYGHITAWIAVTAYFFMPRVFGHAHFAVTETPTTMLTVATVYAFLRGLKSPRWAMACGVLFGLSVATKINGLFLPVMLLPWAFVFRRREALNNLYAMIFLGPAAAIAAWPWMWTDPVAHFLQYLAWNVQHGQIGILYAGTLYGLQNPAPWSYPLAMTAITLPAGTLLLLALGVARALQAPRRYFAMTVLSAWAAFVPMIVLMRPDGPKYDGVRLFLPAFPFLAILAGLGGSVIVRIAAIFDKSRQRVPRSQIALLAIAALIAIDGGCAIVGTAPYYLSYYNTLVRGRAGAAGAYEVTYWGEALNRAAIEQINTKVPDGASLMPLAMHDRVLELYQRWGWLKASIRIVPRGPQGADYYLLHYRRGMFGSIERMLYEGGERRRILRIGPEDAPMFGLYSARGR